MAQNVCWLLRTGILEIESSGYKPTGQKLELLVLATCPGHSWGGPRFWLFSVLCLNSEPVSKKKKKKKKCWKGSLTFWKLQNKISFGKEPLSFEGSPTGLLGQDLPPGCHDPSSPAACMSISQWVGWRQVTLSFQLLDSPEN